MLVERGMGCPTRLLRARRQSLIRLIRTTGVIAVLSFALAGCADGGDGSAPAKTGVFGVGSGGIEAAGLRSCHLGGPVSRVQVPGSEPCRFPHQIPRRLLSTLTFHGSPAMVRRRLPQVFYVSGGVELLFVTAGTIDGADCLLAPAAPDGLQQPAVSVSLPESQRPSSRYRKPFSTVTSKSRQAPPGADT